MNIYHWKSVVELANYAPGKVVVIAENLDQAITTAIKEYRLALEESSCYDSEDIAAKVTSLRDELIKSQAVVYPVEAGAVAFVFQGSD